MMSKYRLFNWTTLKKEKRKESNVIIHRILIPTGYNTMSYKTYVNTLQDIMECYIEVYNDPNQANYYSFILDDDAVSRKEMIGVYELVSSVFTKIMTKNTHREDREYRLGTGEVDKFLNMSFINTKKWLNNCNQCDIVGMEVIGWQKFWKKRMVK